MFEESCYYGRVEGEAKRWFVAKCLCAARATCSVRLWEAQVAREIESQRQRRSTSSVLASLQRTGLGFVEERSEHTSRVVVRWGRDDALRNGLAGGLSERAKIVRRDVRG